MSSLSERKARDLRDRMRWIDRRCTAEMVHALVFNQATNNYFTPRQIARAIKVNARTGRVSHW